MRGFFLLLIVSLVWIPASATTYYISAGGSDAAAGTAKGTAWLHAPGMVGCTGNCALHTPVGDDAFIFRGGDSWHNVTGSPTGLRWDWQWSGTSGHTIYIGGGDQTWDNGSCSTSGIVDTNGTQVLLAAYGESTVGTSSHPFEAASRWNASSSWPGKTITINSVSYTIASVQDAYQLTLTTSAGTQRGVAYSTGSTAWCRPTLNADKAAIAGNTSLDGNMLAGTGTIYLNFDEWEIRGCYMTTAQAGMGEELSISCARWESIVASAPYTISNIYIHDWAHVAFSSTVNNNEGWYLLWFGSDGGTGNGQEVAYVDIDGSDSLDSTFYNHDTGMMQSCASGNVPGGAPVTQYYLDGKCPSASGIGFNAFNGHHIRIKYVQNGTVTNNTHLWHDNIFERIYNTWKPNGDVQHDNCTEQNGEFVGLSDSALFYNNVCRYTAVGITAIINPYSGNPATYVFNNVFYANLQQDFDQDSASGGTVYYYNNTFVVSGIGPVGATGKSFFVNNHWISPSGTTGALLTGGNTETFPVAMTPATATSQGYVAATAYTPTNAMGSTVGTGSNLTSSCGSISSALCSSSTAGGTQTAVARAGGSGAWDVGADTFAAGTTPRVSLSPTSIDFGNVVVNTTTGNSTVTLTNSGTGTLNISSIVKGGADTTRFTLTNGCGSTLATTASCTFTVSFSPLIVTNYSANITVTTDASTSPDLVTLTGAGIPVPNPPIPVTTGGAVVLGGTAVFQ